MVFTECEELPVVDLPGCHNLLFYFSFLLVSDLKYRCFHTQVLKRSIPPAFCLVFNLCFSKATGSLLIYTAQKSLQGLELTDTKTHWCALWKRSKIFNVLSLIKHFTSPGMYVSIRNLGLCIRRLYGSNADSSPYSI